MISIRRRLTLWLLGGSVVVFGVAGGALRLTVEEQLVSQFDRTLAAKARSLGALVEREGAYVEFSYNGEAMPEFQGGADPEYFTLWLADLPGAKSSETLEGEALPRRVGSMAEPESWDLTLPDGRAGRALGVEMPVVGDDEEDDEDGEEEGVPVARADELILAIVVARSREELDMQLAALTTGLVIAASVAMLLLAWGVTWAVRRGLAPLDVLSRDVDRIDASSLSTRLDTEQVPEELKGCALKLNELFARLEGSFAKERRMTAAMAHELRTPIAELRSASDVADRWPEDTLRADVVATAGDVAQRMSRSVEAIMRYCRLEAGQAVLEWEPVGLRTLVDEVWKPYAGRAEERGLRLDNAVPGDVVVETDRGLLALVLRNLVDNATSFGSAGAIRTWWTRDQGGALHVSNEADGLTPEDVSRLTEPFWRKEASRSDQRHSGLGLTLVRSITDVLGYGLRFTLDEAGLRVSIAMRGRLGRAPRNGGDSRVDGRTPPGWSPDRNLRAGGET